MNLFLKKIDKLKEIDLDKFVDDSYLKKAFSELKKEYPSDQELQGEWLPLK